MLSHALHEVGVLCDQLKRPRTSSTKRRKKRQNTLGVDKVDNQASTALEELVRRAESSKQRCTQALPYPQCTPHQSLLSQGIALTGLNDHIHTCHSYGAVVGFDPANLARDALPQVRKICGMNDAPPPASSAYAINASVLTGCTMATIRRAHTCLEPHAHAADQRASRGTPVAGPGAAPWLREKTFESFGGSSCGESQ